MFSTTPVIIKNSICAILFLFLCSHIFVLILDKIKKNTDFSNLKLRMKSWWFILIFLTFIFLGNKAVGLFMVGVICFLALKEYFSFIHFEPDDRKLLFWAYLSIPIQIYFLYTNWLIMFYLFVPLYMFLIIP